MTAPLVDPMAMRQTMGRFATGVAVITTEDASGPHGMTVNSLTSVSLDPPLLLVCFNHGARTAEAAVSSGKFVVNILSRRQQAIALRFAIPVVVNCTLLPVLRTSTLARMGKVCRFSTMPATDWRTESSFSCVAFRTIMSSSSLPNAGRCSG